MPNRLWPGIMPVTAAPAIALPELSAQTGLNRRSEKRSDKPFIEEALGRKGTKVLVLADLKVPIVPSADRSRAILRLLSRGEADAIAAQTFWVFMGEDDEGCAIFACNIHASRISEIQHAVEGLKPLVDLRSLAMQGVLTAAELTIAAQARAILGWHGAHSCCARCGARTQPIDGGWRRCCAACGLDVYPRTDPAVIMLITRGDRCLLGHEHRFPDKFYSTLAGFVEAGDDIEHAVRREVKEEAGIDVGEVRYVASQPWPFPHSLMIGCWGEALTETITIDPTELVDARWFSRAEVASMFAFAHPEGLFVPPAISMAHTLLRCFAGGMF